MRKIRALVVNDKTISIVNIENQDYISLTDMVRGMPNSNVIIGNWLRRKDTIEYLGIWEGLNNPNFKLIEFDEFLQAAGYNRFTLSPSQWNEKTSAIGIISKAGKNGGTYAHRDIAFNFGMWISPAFQLILIKEFQRLKEQESDVYNLEWNYKRFLSKTNYRIQTDAIKDNLIPTIMPGREAIIYAEEADILNLAVFGYTAKQWREMYPDETVICHNIRECADINQLTVIANLQSLNAHLIREKKNKEERFIMLRKEAVKQLESLSRIIADPSLIQSPHKKKAALNSDDTKEGEIEPMPFAKAIEKISTAGKPKE